MLRISEARQVVQVRRPAVGQLRSATRDLHSGLDRHPILHAMKAGTVSRDDYQTYVSCMLKLLEDSLCAVAPWANALQFSASDFLDGRRRDLYALDLQELSETLKNPGAATSKPWPQLGASDQAEACGIMYVVEGSALGAKTLIAPVRASLCPHLSKATKGLAGYGSETGRRWRDLCASLDLALTAPKDIQNAINGARKTFSHTAALLGSNRPS